MKQVTRFIACALASLLVFGGNVFASCGGGGGGDKGKGHKHHGHDSHGGVGVGGSVDLGGVGRRSREPDPFAGSDGSSSSKSQSSEKPKTRHSSVVSNPLEGIKLTGPKAKKTIASADTAVTQPKN